VPIYSDDLKFGGVYSGYWLGTSTVGDLAILCNIKIIEIFADFLWKS
jgi:hypothetical protein